MTFFCLSHQQLPVWCCNHTILPLTFVTFIYCYYVTKKIRLPFYVTQCERSTSFVKYLQRAYRKKKNCRHPYILSFCSRSVGLPGKSLCVEIARDGCLINPTLTGHRQRSNQRGQVHRHLVTLNTPNVGSICTPTSRHNALPNRSN